ncbi:MAG: hypothetical protein GY941_22915, partial [Planctomycetes bacterium]|nr:hypothetical protein [Planctomycetota bacterium]
IVSYTYTVDANQTHADADGNNEITDAIALQVTDSDGDVGNGTLNIKIIDDVPTAANDTASTAEDTPVTVNVVANDEQGADTAVITAASVDAAQGTVTFNAATGEVTFNPKDGFEGDATISYTITDTDGDPSTATLKVTVAPDGVPTITPKPPVTGTDPDAPDVDDVNVVHEQGLRSATDTDTSNVVSDTFSINSTDAISSALVGTGANQKELVGFDFTSGTVDVTTTNGTISITNYDAGTGIVSYTYTVDANQTHADADGNNEITDAIALQVTDSDGDVGNGTLNIK